jgi:hypothetical protein
MVQATLNGFLPPDFDPALMPLIDLENPRPSFAPRDFGSIEIDDARSTEEPGLTEAERFETDGFVLLPHATQVLDWDKDISAIYHGEIDAIVRERLYPGVRVEVQQGPNVLRRGRGTTNDYAGGIHSDGPLTPEDYAVKVAAFAGPQAERWWIQQFERPEVRGFVQIDFWRTTHMQEPLRHMPLALCRPASVDAADVVPTRMIGIAPNRAQSRHLVLRFNPAQQWVHFPAMTNDEVLAFKLCEFSKGEHGARPQNVFHTAFALSASEQVEPRQSCEFRVGVLILRD